MFFDCFGGSPSSSEVLYMDQSMVTVNNSIDNCQSIPNSANNLEMLEKLFCLDEMAQVEEKIGDQDAQRKSF